MVLFFFSGTADAEDDIHAGYAGHDGRIQISTESHDESRDDGNEPWFVFL